MNSKYEIRAENNIDKNKFQKQRAIESASVPKKNTISLGKGRRDFKEIEKIIERKKELDGILREINQIREETDFYNQEIKKLFSKSNSKEIELKKYINFLNGKMLNNEVEYDEKIDQMHEDILLMIEDIQEKIKMEINQTKKEMEQEVQNKFLEAEEKQQKLMNEKIEEQKRIFEKMNNTKMEIEKIKRHFEQTNSQCENLSKEHENLKITLQSLEEDNSSLSKKLSNLKEEYQKLKNKKKIEIGETPNDTGECSSESSMSMEKEERTSHEKDDKLKIEINKQNEILNNHKVMQDSKLTEKYSSDDLSDVENDTNVKENQKEIHNSVEKSPNFKEETNIMNKKTEQGSKQIFSDLNNFQNLNISTPEALVRTLKDAIFDTKKQYKLLRKEYIDEVKRKTEAQQLLQKCIEDLKLEISLSIKDLQNFKKYNINKSNFTDLITVKENNLQNLEHKLRILTFVYDNGFQTGKITKNSLLQK